MNRSLLISIFIASTSQAVLSYLYVLFDAIFTVILTDEEWMNYFYHHKFFKSLGLELPSQNDKFA